MANHEQLTIDELSSLEVDVRAVPLGYLDPKQRMRLIRLVKTEKDRVSRQVGFCDSCKNNGMHHGLCDCSCHRNDGEIPY